VAADSASVLANQEVISIEELPEQSPAPQGGGIASESTVSEATDPLAQARDELNGAPERDVEELTPNSVAPQHGKWPAAQPNGFSTYYLEIGPEDLANLKIVQLSPWHGESDLRVRSSSNDVDVFLAFSRLDHLQARLDELRKVLTSKRLIDSQRASQSLFQIEDVLTHMKRATDELFHLDHGAHGHDLRSIMVWNGAASGQPELPLLSVSAGEHCDAPLADVLDRLVDNLPWSVNVLNHERASDPSAAEAGTRVHLGDLVWSFNEFVKAAFATRGSRTSRMTTDG
jgi:hypothetical protein